MQLKQEVATDSGVVFEALPLAAAYCDIQTKLRSDLSLREIMKNPKTKSTPEAATVA
jgi:hypothetical protein